MRCNIIKHYFVVFVRNLARHEINENLNIPVNFLKFGCFTEFINGNSATLITAVSPSTSEKLPFSGAESTT